MADLIISQPMTFMVDVKNGLVERPQRESLMRGDKMANRIIAELVDGSEPFDITGVTVKGKFCRPPNGDEIDLTGEAKGNVAEVQLTDKCYTSGGHYEARVILVLGGVERTVLFISGDVLKSGSGNAAGDEETGGSGSTGSGLPAGGTAGQVLVKVTSAQGDAIWKTLTAADVGARPDNWMPTAEDVGALPSEGTAVNANALNGKDADEYALVTDLPTKASDVGALASDGTAVNSAKLDGKDSVYYLGARNLLDNSDFRNPVNQRGQTSYVGNGYTIDRWRTWDDSAVVNIASGYISHDRVMMQYVIGVNKDVPHTFAVCDNNDVLHIVSGIPINSPINAEELAMGYEQGYDAVYVSIPGAIWGMKWAALYEGEYTADNLPPYVPKEPETEWAACRRYRIPFGINAFLGWAVVNANGLTCQGFIPCEKMRINNPTIEGELMLWTGQVTVGIASIETGTYQGNGLRITLTGASQLTAGSMVAIYANTNVAFNADL